MVEAERLRIVFRVGGVGFVMPVADLLAIRGAGEDPLSQPRSSAGACQVGSLVYRSVSIGLYALTLLFGLPRDESSGDGHVLVFAGMDGPWAIRVDQVDGVKAVDQFVFQELPAYLFRDVNVPYHQVALHDGQLLVSVDAERLDHAWRRSD